MSEAAQAYLEHLEGATGRPGEPDDLGRLRGDGAQAFSAHGFPTVREEEWRFTNVAPLARRGFPPVAEGGSVDAATVAAMSYEGFDRLVFVDGRLAVEHCRLGDLPDRVRVGSLAAAIAEGDERVTAQLGRHASVEHQPFAALNTALFVDGPVVLVPDGVALERPIQVVFLASEAAEGRAIYSRNLLVAGATAEVTVVESYGGVAGEYFHSVVGEYVGGPGSQIDHYKLQREREGAFHIATLQTWLDRDTVFRSHNISLGGGLVRNDVNAVLDGEGIDCILNGLYVARNEQLVDTHMRVEHKKPHCDSHELYKGILDDRARAVFNGRIYVHQDAQKTDAKQTNRNLLLSDGALVNSNPQLEIFADDVRCTHGSTVGQLDEEAIFYLRSRGIEETAARSLLTYAFAAEVADWIRVDPVRVELEEFLFGRLAAGEIVRQAV
ncbi:MAG: Fe-S cluster assembly protein SufD [Thermoanaerobaculia bacterium]|nr:Fe-S cluster assembly protein SufD [Thermoanaerobaculia bacterium]